MSGEVLASSMAPTLAASCAAVALASLLGSVHCAGMCGGLAACATPLGAAKSVTLTSSVGRGSPRAVAGSLLPMQLAYHGARLSGYALLGLAAGSLGAALDLGGSLLGVQRVASLAAGATIAIIGAVMLLRVSGVRIPHLPVPGAITRLFSATHRRAMTWPPTLRAMAIGGVTPLLPCGWLYAFVAIAAGAGSALGGAAVMAAFWLGTVPALVAIAVGVRLAFRLGATRLGRALPVAAALLMIGIGCHIAIVRGGKAAIVASSVHPVAASGGGAEGEAALRKAIDEVDDELPACCRGEAEP